MNIIEVMAKICVTFAIIGFAALTADFIQWVYDGKPTHPIQGKVRFISWSISGFLLFVMAIAGIWGVR